MVVSRSRSNAIVEDEWSEIFDVFENGTIDPSLELVDLYLHSSVTTPTRYHSPPRLFSYTPFSPQATLKVFAPHVNLTTSSCPIHTPLHHKHIARHYAHMLKAYEWNVSLFPLPIQWSCMYECERLGSGGILGVRCGCWWV